jgi:hypothetical protein
MRSLLGPAIEVIKRTLQTCRSRIGGRRVVVVPIVVVVVVVQDRPARTPAVATSLVPNGVD